MLMLGRCIKPRVIRVGLLDISFCFRSLRQRGYKFCTEDPPLAHPFSRVEMVSAQFTLSISPMCLGEIGFDGA